MNSLYSLFGTTREVLKAAGPDVGASRDSVGGIAIAVLIAIRINKLFYYLIHLSIFSDSLLVPR
ncbi:hypothetical protein OGM63_27680 [Plectonema radiosum NIES-515]|uniref:Uncharacterized protein n=1 Tax=Plectonema radiosum NIES-515 TaxID=2986073 RepID=A0ABT3B791_9CYAN|nr:hypothetical protein [Plectonema radiosum]MCV3217246.1 hypothetical protein [Plectonema radiosum NIES-515]